MIRGLLHVFLATAAFATAAPAEEKLSERAIEARLHEILGTKSFVRSTLWGPLKFIDDHERMDARYEQYRLFGVLQGMATREAVRVLAGYLDDDRHTHSPGDDYGSSPLCMDAEGALSGIQRRHPEVVPGAPSPPDPSSKEWSQWWRSIKGDPIGAWRQWWAANKAAYETPTPATPTPK